MMKKIQIIYDNHKVDIASELEGQELYEAYVALTAHIAERLNNRNDIVHMSCQAAKDALSKIVRNKS